MKPHDLNSLYLWLPMNTNELSIKSYAEGYPYRHKGILFQSNLTTPIYRYAKNYIIDGKKFSLCLISTEKDTTKMEKWLDEQAKKIDSKEIIPKFKMLNIFYETKT